MFSQYKNNTIEEINDAIEQAQIKIKIFTKKSKATFAPRHLVVSSQKIVRSSECDLEEAYRALARRGINTKENNTKAKAILDYHMGRTDSY